MRKISAPHLSSRGPSLPDKLLRGFLLSSSPPSLSPLPPTPPHKKRKRKIACSARVRLCYLVSIFLFWDRRSGARFLVTLLLTIVEREKQRELQRQDAINHNFAKTAVRASVALCRRHGCATTFFFGTVCMHHFIV